MHLLCLGNWRTQAHVHWQRDVRTLTRAHIPYIPYSGTQPQSTSTRVHQQRPHKGHLGTFQTITLSACVSHAAAERERVSISNVASTMAAMMATQPLIPALDLSCLRIASCGGSPQAPVVVRWVLPIPITFLAVQQKVGAVGRPRLVRRLAPGFRGGQVGQGSGPLAAEHTPEQQKVGGWCSPLVCGLLLPGSASSALQHVA